ncbi:MAG: electron transfer flavoprotein subunit beta/FixA family protein [Peptococcaceae bacterium]|nr:electron transfer flavoprotein subunit beta/FixA family protein [Peptococcaceae bacterium]
MSGLKIAVCIKPVPSPDQYHRVGIDPRTKTLVREGIPTVINPLDKNALEAALQIREKCGGTVAAISMAPPAAEENLREALAMGADEAYLLSDRAFAGSDTLATSMVLAAAVKKLGPVDLVLTGNESADGGTAQVSAQLGEWLGYPHLMHACGLEVMEDGFIRVDTAREDCRVAYRVKLPAVVSVVRTINKPRFTSLMGVIAAGKKPLSVWTSGDLPVDENFLGLEGSPTKAGDIYQPDLSRRCELLEGSAGEIAGAVLQKLRAAGLQL